MAPGAALVAAGLPDEVAPVVGVPVPVAVVELDELLLHDVTASPATIMNGRRKPVALMCTFAVLCDELGKRSSWGGGCVARQAGERRRGR
jgi:hypothetical protein